jgi:hypothetical protein
MYNKNRPVTQEEKPAYSYFLLEYSLSIFANYFSMLSNSTSKMRAENGLI